MQDTDTSMGFPTLNEGDLPVEYVPGGGADFVVFIQGLKNKAQLHSVDGHARWVVTREDGSRYIARPQEANAN